MFFNDIDLGGGKGKKKNMSTAGD
jgi:hypothetical protein